MLVYYTNISNLIALLACMGMVCLELPALKKKKILCKAVYRFKYMAVCMTTLTMLVVIAILAPLQGIEMLYRGNFLFFHVLCPVFMLVSFLATDKKTEYLTDKRVILLGGFPTVLYAAVTVLLNCARVLDGPYPFLKVYGQPVWASVLWAALVLGIAGLSAYLLWKSNR